jgi:hypothetical protein
VAASLAVAALGLTELPPLVPVEGEKVTDTAA